MNTFNQTLFMMKMYFVLLVFVSSNLFAQPKILTALSYLGQQNGGALYRLNLPATTTPGVIHSFNHLAPHRPTTGVTAGDGDWLYGTLTYNGVNENGAFYRVETDGSNFSIIQSLISSNYINPVYHTDGQVYFGNGSYRISKFNTTNNVITDIDILNGVGSRNLLIENDWMYFFSQANSIVKIKTDGTDYTVMHELNDPTEGLYGTPGLTAVADSLFGLTDYGGTYGGGTIFSIKKDGTGFKVHHQFDTASGYDPESKLVLFDGKLYGTTMQGGNFNHGVLFTMNPDGTGYKVIHHIESGTYATGFVSGDLSIAQNGRIFGSFQQLYYTTTAYRLFKIDTSGENFQPFIDELNARQRDFGNGHVNILLTDNDESIYVTTIEMGRHDGGVLSRFDTTSTGTSLFQFGRSPNGFRPFSSPIVGMDGKLYGTAYVGGDYGNGVIYSVNPNGSNYTMLHEFLDTEGYELHGKLLEGSDGRLYGVCRWTDISYGIVYRINKNGTGFQVIHSFSNVGDGYYPYGNLVENNGQIYGTTYSSTPGAGVIYKMNLDGSNYTVLKNFDGISGLSYPADGVIVSGDYVYGLSMFGGPANRGGIYRIKKDGTNYQELHQFDGSDGGQANTKPVIANNGKLYGVTPFYGLNNEGTIFSIDTTGTNFSNLHHFTSSTDGTYSRGIIEASDGLLYGTNANSYINPNGGGNIFRINPNGTGFTVLKEFDLTTEGGYPTDLIDLNLSPILPVHLLDFTAKKSYENVVVEWKTADEQNSDRFEIERSADGSYFTKIGSVKSSNARNAVTVYDFIDSRPLNGKNFYRLKQVDKNGTFTYSPIASVNFSSVHSITISPNPVTSILNIRLNADNDFASFELFDANGKIVLKKSIRRGTIHISENIQQLPKGWYLLRLHGSEIKQESLIIN